ncbi:hypothetical protein JCM10207_002090 [Rhodosporidiobolus poonsookiae]
MTGSIALPTSADTSPLLKPHSRSSHRSLRRPAATLAWLTAGCTLFFLGYLSHQLPPAATYMPAAVTSLSESTSSFLPSSLRSHPFLQRTHSRTPSRKPPPSCRLCDSTPDDPLCQYGDSAVRLSRAYEGSGLRVRRFLEKAMRGEEVTVGIIGASVTAGHGLGPGEMSWVEQWFENFQTKFPRAQLVNGAAPAMTSKFYSYCHETMLPGKIDLYIIELDINDEVTAETFVAQDALLRSLLDQPHQPAVMKASVFALSFEDLIRGTSASLTLAQYFDVPIVSVRNVLQPLTISHPDLAPSFFTTFPNGQPDLRHLNKIGHRVLGDMFTHYLHEQSCLASQEQHRPRLQPKFGSLWPSEDVYEAVPRLHLWKPFSETFQAERVTPTCKFASSTTRPLVALPPSEDGRDGRPWERMEWNDKAALASNEVGSLVRFGVEGTSVGVFIWQWPGNPHTRPEKMPGQMSCWVDNQLDQAMLIDTYSVATAAVPTWVMVQESLQAGKHVLTCQILQSSSTSGHEVRIIGVVSH